MANSIGQSCNKCINHPVFICILRFFQWLPVFFIVAVVSWAYYAYVIELCFFTVNNILERIVYLIPFHVFLVLFLWSYYQTVFTKVGAPSSKFVMPPEVLSDLEEAPRATDHRLILDRFQRDRDLPIAMRAFDGAVRFCDKCKLVKPDRCHHCSVCGQCVLKFDHHCPWVNTCVNFRNYKFFIQFLGYALVFCLFIFFTDFKYFIWFWEVSHLHKEERLKRYENTGLKEEGASKFHIMFMFFVSGMFAISVSTLFFYHLWLTSRNRTTIESFRDPVFTYGPDKHGFSLGWRQNFMEVFGERPLLWFLPVFSARGNGCDFKTPNRLRGERDARHRDEAAGESRDQQDPEDPDGTPGSANGKSNPPGRSSPGRSSPRNGSLSGSPRPNQWLPETGPWGSDKPTDRIVGKNSTDRGKRDSYGSDGYLSSRSRTLPENSGRISSSMLIDEILSKDQSPHLSSASPSSFDRVEQIRHGNGLSFPTPTYEAETDSLLTAQRSEQMQQDNDSDVERRMTQYNPHSNYPHSDRPSHDEFRDDDDGWGKFTAAEPPPDPLVMRDIPLNSIATPILITARS